MKLKFALTVVLATLISIANVSGQELLDFGRFDIKVTETKEIESFTGESGTVISASKRSNRLIEVKLEITSYDEGDFALYPKMFSCMFPYRGEVLVVPAVAFGTKITDKSTGEITEYWYHDPEVSIILGVGKNEKFRKYVILELPEETERFYLQGPKVIAEVEP